LKPSDSLAGGQPTGPKAPVHPAPLALVSVPFQGGALLAAAGSYPEEGDRLVPLAPFCERLGINADTQRKKLARVAWTCPVIMTVQIPGDDQARRLACIPLRALAGWLFTINPGKVAPEARAALVAYQREAADVLYRHFLAPPVDAAALAKLTADLEQLRGEVRSFAQGRRRLSDHDARRVRAYCQDCQQTTPMEIFSNVLGWELPDEVEIRAIERLLKDLGFKSTWRRPRFVRSNEGALWARPAAQLSGGCA
jgi:hypothetical protein